MGRSYITFGDEALGLDRRVVQLICAMILDELTKRSGEDVVRRTLARLEGGILDRQLFRAGPTSVDFDELCPSIEELCYLEDLLRAKLQQVRGLGMTFPSDFLDRLPGGQRVRKWPSFLQNPPTPQNVGEIIETKPTEEALQEVLSLIGKHAVQGRSV
ncbi:MAG: hypothetical protein MN733_32850 [Nitrososphaera sp.]|nr:hypothetical protein [Nitrososphaera sp.]